MQVAPESAGIGQRAERRKGLAVIDEARRQIATFRQNSACYG